MRKIGDKKIAVIGLDSAGKTSILTAIKQKFDYEKTVRTLKPTIKVERSGISFMRSQLLNWDFGGQKKYRDEYLAHKDRYLGDVDLLYLVYDVQDSLRINEAFDYFNEIVMYLRDSNLKIPIVVMLHKVDPNFVEDPTIKNNISTIREKCQPWLEFTAVRFFSTTIFDIETLIRAFSAGIRMVYTQSEAIERFILGLVEKLENVMALLIFEQSGISIGEYYLEHITLGMKKKILTLYEMAQKRIITRNTNSYEFSDRIDAWTKISGLIQSFEIEGVVFFILLVVEEHEDLEDIVEEFNFFEKSYPEMKEILRTLLLDEPEVSEKLNPNGKKT